MKKTVIVNAHVVSPGVDIEKATIIVEGKKIKHGSEKIQGSLGIERFPQYFEMYLQELNQIPTVNFRETFLHASSRWKRKGTIVRDTGTLSS